MYREISCAAVAVLAFIVAKPAAADDRSVCQSGNGEDRIAACSRVLARSAKDSNAFNNRGIAYSDKEDRDRAISDFSQAISLNPKNATFYSNRGAEYWRKHEYDRAIADANQAITLDPKKVEAYNIRGLSYSGKGDDDRAVGDYSIAITLNPGNASAAYHNRANVYGRRGDFDRAIADSNMALSLAPKQPRIYAFRGRIYNNKGEYDRAIDDLSTSISLNPKEATPYGYRGFAYARKGDFDRALVDANRAIALDPKEAAGYANRAAVYALRGDADRAVADANEAIRLDSESGLAYNWRGKAWLDKGEYDRAIADFDQALKLDPGAAMEARQGRERAAAALAAKQTPAPPVVQVAPQPAPPRPAVQAALPPEPARALAAGPGQAGKRALVIGIDSYPSLGGGARLERAVADAEAVGDQLVALGFQVTRLTTARQGTLNGLLRGVDEFRRTVARNDVVVLFFAGHGMGLSDGVYLVPSDVSDASLEVEATARRAAISENEITDGLQRAGAGAVVAVIDARHNDLFLRAAKRVHPAETEGVFKLYAAGDGQTALDSLPGGDGAKTSVFARVFIKAIGTPGLDLNRLGVRVRDEVFRLARSADHRQIPAVYDKLIGSTEVYFAGETAAAGR